MTTNRTDLDRIIQEGFLTSTQATKLKAAGIEDGPHLVTAWCNPAERMRLAQAAEMPVNLLMQAVFVANLLQQSAPGEVGIDILLQHKDEMIPEFEDNEKDHEFVCQGRQEILQYAGRLIYANERLRIKYSLLPKASFYKWILGLTFFVLLGLIVYTHWNALVANFGSDVTSQLAQVLDRREALMLSGVVLLLLGVEGGIIFLGSFSLFRSINLWLSDTINGWIGRTPRDVLVWLEAQDRIPPAWAKVDQILDLVAIFIWAVPIFVGSFLPSVQGWASLILFVLLFTWIFLKIIVFNVAFNHMGHAWAQQARARQAGLMLSKMISVTLVTLLLYAIWFFTFWLASLGVYAWTQSQAQIANSEMQVLLAQQTIELDLLVNLNQFFLETTQAWINLGKGMVDWCVAWLPVATQMVSVSLFAIASGATLGWYIFVRRKGWIKAILLLSLVYLVSNIVPVLAAWWFFQAPQNLIDPRLNIPDLLLTLWQTVVSNIPGLTIGLFFALGQDVFENSQDRHLKYECPECYLLMSEPTCECGRKRGFEKVLDL